MVNESLIYKIRDRQWRHGKAHAVYVDDFEEILRQHTASPEVMNALRLIAIMKVDHSIPGASKTAFEYVQNTAIAAMGEPPLVAGAEAIGAEGGRAPSPAKCDYITGMHEMEHADDCRRCAKESDEETEDRKNYAAIVQGLEANKDRALVTLDEVERRCEISVHPATLEDIIRGRFQFLGYENPITDAREAMKAIEPYVSYSKPVTRQLEALKNVLRFADGRCWPEVQAAIDANREILKHVG